MCSEFELHSVGIIEPFILKTLTTLKLRNMIRGVCYSELKENGGHIDITDSWSRSILKRMGFKKRCSTSGKLQLPSELITQ